MSNGQINYESWLFNFYNGIRYNVPRNMGNNYLRATKWCRHMVLLHSCPYGEKCHFVHHFNEFREKQCSKDYDGKRCKNKLCPWKHKSDVNDLKSQLRQFQTLYNTLNKVIIEKTTTNLTMRHKDLKEAKDQVLKLQAENKRLKERLRLCKE